MSDTRRYQWVLVSDVLLEHTGDRVLLVGPRGASGRSDVRKTVLEGEQFRLCDRQGRVRYTGYISGVYAGPEPLEDYGKTHGCARIEFEHEGKWVATSARGATAGSESDEAADAPGVRSSPVR